MAFDLSSYTCVIHIESLQHFKLLFILESVLHWVVSTDSWSVSSYELLHVGPNDTIVIDPVRDGKARVLLEYMAFFLVHQFLAENGGSRIY